MSRLTELRPWLPRLVLLSVLVVVFAGVADGVHRHTHGPFDSCLSCQFGADADAVLPPTPQPLPVAASSSVSCGPAVPSCSGLARSYDSRGPPHQV